MKTPKKPKQPKYSQELVQLLLASHSPFVLTPSGNINPVTHQGEFLCTDVYPLLSLDGQQVTIIEVAESEFLAKAGYIALADEEGMGKYPSVNLFARLLGLYVMGPILLTPSKLFP